MTSDIDEKVPSSAKKSKYRIFVYMCTLYIAPSKYYTISGNSEDTDQLASNEAS